MGGTAIVAIHAEEGFLIAADGRRRKGEVILNEDEQKIFNLPPTSSLAFALAGVTSTEDSHPDFRGLAFDFRRVLFDASGAEADNFWRYAQKVSKTSNAKLLSLKRQFPAKVLLSLGGCLQPACSGPPGSEDLHALLAALRGHVHQGVALAAQLTVWNHHL